MRNFGFKNEGLCIKTEEFYSKNDEFCRTPSMLCMIASASPVLF